MISATPVRLLGPAEVRALAAQLGLRPTKSRGQNFVIDPNTVRRIVRTAGVGADDVVLEVGPGLGSLTLGLLDKVREVIAVEVDQVLASALPDTMARYAPDHADRLTVLAADAAAVQELPAAPTALVANLPYNVAVPVLLHLLARFESIHTVLVMVQAEVADRLVAAPGSRVYGVPSVKAAWYGSAQSAGRVGRTVFWPVPNVDSGLVRLVRAQSPATTVDRRDVFRVVDAAFAQRRKMLRTALSDLAGSPAAAAAVLVAADVEPTARGEALAVTDFVRIAESLALIRDSVGSGADATNHCAGGSPQRRSGSDQQAGEP